MRTSLLLIIGFVAIICAVAMPATATWTPVPDSEDQKYQNLGRWAVNEHNKQAHDSIFLVLAYDVKKQDLDIQLEFSGWRSSSDTKGAFRTVVRTDAAGKAVKLISFEQVYN